MILADNISNSHIEYDNETKYGVFRGQTWSNSFCCAIIYAYITEIYIGERNKHSLFQELLDKFGIIGFFNKNIQL